jgi:hypothetical protein
MLYNCYLKQSLVYVPTVGRRGGAYTDIEPVTVVSVANNEGLRIAFLETMARKNISVPPIKGKWLPPVLLKYARVKTWAAFARGAATWSIVDDDGVYQICGHRMHPKGYWVEDPEQKIEFPAGTSVDVVIDRMIAILQEAAQK